MEGNLPIERSGHSAVAHEGIMYMWGGHKDGSYFNDLFVFNSSTCKSTLTKSGISNIFFDISVFSDF